MNTIKASITGISCWLPEDRLTNSDIEKMVDTNNEWILERSGVSERRILRDPDKGSAYMGAEAVKLLLEKKNIDPMTIDLIICSTATPEMQFPATATIISDLIGTKRAWSFDLKGACSGFIYSLNVARQFIETGAHKRVLVIGTDKMSSIVDYTDRATCILFGDGAGAALLEPDTTGTGILDARMYSDGSGRFSLYQPAGGSLRPATEETVRNREHFIKMNGQGVFKMAVEKMADVSEEMMLRNNLESKDIAFLVPHQANKRIIEATAHRMGIGNEKVMLNIQKYGNTTTATLPICLTEWENQLKRGDNIILTTFGAGFTWGGMYIKWAYDKVKRDPSSDEMESLKVVKLES
ncbi:MAG TPA: beta-ketoacyl-ACP synthase III [Bacteroidia bacterium]|nr:beta-ketoacyl-ACP synthase III [Bacteroidia bacterium]